MYCIHHKWLSSDKNGRFFIFINEHYVFCIGYLGQRQGLTTAGVNFTSKNKYIISLNYERNSAWIWRLNKIISINIYWWKLTPVVIRPWTPTYTCNVNIFLTFICFILFFIGVQIIHLMFDFDFIFYFYILSSKTLT